MKMKTEDFLKGFITISFLLLFPLMVKITNGFCAQVNKEEAAAVADLWYAMELNSGYIKIEKPEREERLKNVQNRQMFYMISKDELLDIPPVKDEVLAYVIKYDPSGYVIVSGDDRIEPIIVFDAKAEFRWDQPEINFLRYFLGKEMPGRTECIKTKVAKGEMVDVHPKWNKLRSNMQKHKNLEGVTFRTAEAGIISKANDTSEAALGTTFVHWKTPIWNQDPFYNDTVVVNNGNTANIPTGCVATAMAEKMRFHEWPPSGNGTHTYTDNSGAINFSHTVNFGNQTYNWANMPKTNITTTNPDVADLMYHAGVSVDMDYEVGASGTLTWYAAGAMNEHFRYKGGEAKFFPYDDHENLAKESIIGGLPVVMGGSGHAVVAGGYRDTESPYFYLNVGWGGQCNGWYSLSDFPNSATCSGGTIDKSNPYSSPDNYIYVDGIWRLFPNGNIQSAYRTLADGYSAVPSGGHLWIKGGTNTGSDVPITFEKPMTIQSYAGAVTIGQ